MLMDQGLLDAFLAHRRVARAILADEFYDFREGVRLADSVWPAGLLLERLWGERIESFQPPAECGCGNLELGAHGSDVAIVIDGKKEPCKALPCRATQVEFVGFLTEVFDVLSSLVMEVRELHFGCECVVFASLSVILL